MNTEQEKNSRKNPLRTVVWSVAGLALLTPWVAMQFTTEVNWDSTDFVVFGTMLFVVCGAYDIATRLTGSKAYRLAVGIALLGTFLLTWINLAVGIVGNEENPLNLLFFIAPLTGIVGSMLARFRPRGMAYAMVATAFVQAIVALALLVGGWGFTLVLSGFFVIVWLASAHLFSKAAQQQ